MRESALMSLSVNDWSGCVETLHAGQYSLLAAQLLEICPDLGQRVETNVLREAVWLEMARFMAECGNMPAVLFYCARAGGKGEELRKELEFVAKQKLDKGSSSAEE